MNINLATQIMESLAIKKGSKLYRVSDGKLLGTVTKVEYNDNYGVTQGDIYITTQDTNGEWHTHNLAFFEHLIDVRWEHKGV